jgi:hypothetical protein
MRTRSGSSGYAAASLPAFPVRPPVQVLRISEEDEHRGLDASKHGGAAYNMGGGPGESKPASGGGGLEPYLKA